MVNHFSPDEEQSGGLIVQALDAITTAYKVGGYLLAAMVSGTVIILLSMLIKSEFPQKMGMVVGAVVLILPMLVVLFLYVKPLRDLKRQLDEKMAFLSATEDGVVKMAQTVRSFSDAIVVNNKNTAEALKMVRPYLGSFPTIANWVDSSEDLSRELAVNSLALRDAATSIENAFKDGDTEALRESIRRSQQIAEKIKVAASPGKLIGRMNGEIAHKLHGLKDNEALEMLNSPITVASAFLQEAKNTKK